MCDARDCSSATCLARTVLLLPVVALPFRVGGPCVATRFGCGRREDVGAGCSLNQDRRLGPINSHGGVPHGR